MQTTIRRKSQDLTEGTIWKQLIVFALPLLGSSLIQQLYNTVDLLFVGNLLSKDPYAAVGASSMIISCLVGFFTGMSVGSGVVISHAIGSRNRRLTQDSVHTAVGLSLAGGIILMIVGLIGAPYFLTWMHVDPRILTEAVSYLRIYFLSLTSVLAYNMASGIIRSMGNSSVPMLTQLAGGIANVIAEGMKLIRITFLFYWLYDILEILADTIRGAEKALPPMLIILFGICILRTVLLFTIMPRWHDIRGIAVTYPITWGMTAVGMMIYYARMEHRSKKDR